MHDILIIDDFLTESECDELVTLFESSPLKDNQNKFPMRNYASLIYLNRDFEGGKLYIPELNFELSPKKGQLVTFEGGRLKHGVTKITKGRRITSICWFKI